MDHLHSSTRVRASKAPGIQLQWSTAGAKVRDATQLLDQIESES
jgi:hypothetical protein